jgi:hypothetical protein
LRKFTVFLVILLPTILLGQPRTVAKYFELKNWHYPINYELPDTIKVDKETSDTIPPKVMDVLKTLKRDSVIMAIKNYFNSVHDTGKFFKDFDPLYGMRVVNAEYEYQGGKILVWACLFTYYHSERKLICGKNIFCDVFRIANESNYIYYKRCGFTLSLQKGYGLKFLYADP